MGNEKSKEQYSLIESYTVHFPQPKARKSVLFGECSWAAKYCVGFAYFDYKTPAPDLPSWT